MPTHAPRGVGGHVPGGPRRRLSLPLATTVAVVAFVIVYAVVQYQLHPSSSRGATTRGAVTARSGDTSHLTRMPRSTHPATHHQQHQQSLAHHDDNDGDAKGRHDVPATPAPSSETESSSRHEGSSREDASSRGRQHQERVASGDVGDIPRGTLSCNATWDGNFAAHADYSGAHRRYGRDALEADLAAQLLTYKKRVREKLQREGGPPSAQWRAYHAAHIDAAFCAAQFPECSVFNRSDLFLDADQRRAGLLAGDGSPHDAASNMSPDEFMLRKCCIEHFQMLRALRSLYAALRAADDSEARAKAKAKKRHTPLEAWLTAGSLLAAVRERGVFIPWDTDVDILVRPEHEDAVLNILKAHARERTPSKQAPEIHVGEREDEDDPLKFATKPVEHVKDHAHGRMIGVVYGAPQYIDEEASRVEVWVAQETKKMQRASINLPTQECVMHDVTVRCPAQPLQVIEHGYGPYWCVPCKARSSNCKDVMERRLKSASRRGDGATP